MAWRRRRRDLGEGSRLKEKPELGRESCYGELRELFRDCREKITREKTI